MKIMCYNIVYNVITLIMIVIFLDVGMKTNKITNRLLYMICKDNMPLNTTEKEGFRYFMRSIEPEV